MKWHTTVQGTDRAGRVWFRKEFNDATRNIGRRAYWRVRSDIIGKAKTADRDPEFSQRIREGLPPRPLDE